MAGPDGRNALGNRGERIAAKALKKAGYRILGRNVRLGRNELDLIAQEGDTVAFVEVKTRHESDVYGAADNITATKRRNLLQAARAYLAEARQDGLYYRFDVVTVTIPQRGRPDVAIYRNAFAAE
jgi:putative endonuclease